MLKFNASAFLRLMESLIGSQLEVNERLSKDPNAATKKLPDEEIPLVEKYLNIFEKECGQIGLSGSCLHLKVIKDNLKDMQWGPLHEQLKTFRQMIQEEMKQHLFLYVETGKAKWYVLPQPFGDVVTTTFPSTSYDIVEASKCLALERYTACVLHVMRVLEKGLWAFAKDLNISFQAENWGTIIDQIKSKIDPMIRDKKSPERDERIQFYSEAAKEFAYFKDGWRNYAMHSKSKYSEEEALQIFNHVNDFMNHLSKKLKESDF